MLVGFRWIMNGMLAGSGRPGLLRSEEEDMRFIRAAGIEVLVTLTEEPLAVPAVIYGLESIHFPVPDMGFPTPRECDQVCSRIGELLAAKRPVLVHCKAGLGRTGTMLACCLVEQGASADAAISRVRRVQSQYIQTAAQAAFVKHYEVFRSKNGH